MRILFDIGHPAHVHYFRNIYFLLKEKGHEFVFTARDKEMSHYLLHRYNIPYYNRGKGSDSFLGKLFYMLKADLVLLKIAKKYKPDIFLSFASPYAAQTAFLMRKPCITFDDTENAKIGQFFYKPFTKHIITPSCFKKNMGKKHIRFNGYMELCYLHPSYFKPDISILKDLEVNRNVKFVIIRFVKWKANHDISHSGMTLENKIQAVNRFSQFAKVFITSENELPVSLEPYRISIPPERIHHAMAFASLLFGESSTMASESAVLGVPAVYIDNVGRGYTTEEEKYNLVFNFTESPVDQQKAIDKGVDILSSSNRYSNKQLLAEKIDATKYIVELIDNYPASINTLHSVTRS